MLYRFITRIKIILRWVPILWRQYDFDYCYAIEVFEFQLKNIAKFLESDKACSVDAKRDAQRIRTVLRLMEKVYDEEYALEYLDVLEKRYGKSKVAWHPTEDPKLHRMHIRYAEPYEDWQLEEIDKERTTLLLEAQAKQDRAHKLLWKLIEHNIQKWWD